jgi:hypothetical protein
MRRLARPVVTADKPSGIAGDLRRRLRPRLLHENPQEFADVYPLGHEDGRLVRRRSGTEASRGGGRER